MTTPRKVTRQRPAASSEIATPRLQAELETLTTGAAATAPRRDGAPSQRHDGTTAAEPARVKFTLLFTETDAAAFDQLVLDMRAATGRRRLDKATIVRALLSLADTDDRTRSALLSSLRTP
jgi:hypothetical protein